MFCQTTRQIPFWLAAALLAVLAAPHTLLAQDATRTVRVEVTNETAKPVEFALVGPDGKDYGPARSVQSGRTYRSSNRTLPGDSARGWKWVVRDPDTGRVLKDVKADRAQRSITIDKGKRPADSGSAQTPKEKGQAPAGETKQDATRTVRVEVTNETAKPVEFALVGPDGKDYGPARSVQPGRTYRSSNRTLPGDSARGWKWVVRDPDTGRVLKDVKADRAQRSITVGKGKQ